MPRHRPRPDEGICVLAVLHDLDLASISTDEILVMSHGRAADEPGDQALRC